MDDYKSIKSILKAARKLAKKRGYSEKRFLKQKADLQSRRTGDRKKLEKAAKKLYEMFDHHIIGEEIILYSDLLRIAKTYASTNSDLTTLKLDEAWVADIKKRNDTLKSSYHTLADIIKNHPFDQERIDMAIEKLIKDADDISHFDKVGESIEETVKTWDKAAEKKGYTLKQRGLAIIAGVAVGIAAYTANVSKNLGFAGFGGGTAYAGQVDQIKQAEQLNTEGEKLYHNKKYKASEEKFEKAIELDPSNPDYYYNLATAYMTQGKNKEAVPILEKFIQLSPNDPTVPNIKKWLEKNK